MTEEKGRYRVGSRLVVTCADNSEVENDWWSECRNCYARVSIDSEGAEGVPHDPVFDGKVVYCSQSCKDQADSEKGGGA